MRHRAAVRAAGGKEQFPFLVDENTGRTLYESDAIVRYLYETYGGNTLRPPPMLLESTLLTGCAAATVEDFTTNAAGYEAAVVIRHIWQAQGRKLLCDPMPCCVGKSTQPVHVHGYSVLSMEEGGMWAGGCLRYSGLAGAWCATRELQQKRPPSC